MFSAKHTTDQNEHIVSLSYNPPPNAGSVEHPPIDIHFVIDVSYSMDDIIPDPSGEGNSLSILDLVKHTVKSLVNSMSDKDRVSIVKYSTAAQIVLSNVPTSDLNKPDILQKITELHTEGSTNIFFTEARARGAFSAGGDLGWMRQQIDSYRDQPCLY